MLAAQLVSRPRHLHKGTPTLFLDNLTRARRIKVERAESLRRDVDRGAPLRRQVKVCGALSKTTNSSSGN